VPTLALATPIERGDGVLLRDPSPGGGAAAGADPAEAGRLPVPVRGRPARPGSILVTGGAGYIGSHVVLALLAAGWPVVVLDNLTTGGLRGLHGQCTVAIGEAGDRGLVRRLLTEHDVAGVVHLAGSIVVPDSVRRPLGYYANNTLVSHSLIQACVEHGFGAFVFSSTAAVYGAVGRSPVDEEAPARPCSPFGTSKLMVEQMLRDAGEAYDLPHAILRYFNVGGADPLGRCGQGRAGGGGDGGGPGGATHLLKVACEAALGRRPFLPVFGTDWPTRDGTCVRDFVHVSDLASAHAAALDHLFGGGESVTLNCGCGRGHSVREVAAAVGRVSGRTLDLAPAPRRAGDPPEVVACPERMRRTLGWRPRHLDLDTIVGHALAWERFLQHEAAGATRAAGVEPSPLVA
jgi:UDP-glucose 4-epimerase